MRIRVQIAPWRPFASNRFTKIAYAASLLLAPSAVIAFTLALWNIAAEMHWTGEFFISHGFFSHSQVWIGASAVLVVVLRLLHRATAAERVMLDADDAVSR